MILLAVAAAVASPADKQQFVFRDVAAGVAIEHTEAFPNCDKGKKSTDRICQAWPKSTVAGAEMGLFAIRLINGKLSNMLGEFKSRDAWKIIDAFREKYGQPCNEEVRQWRSVVGITAQSRVVKWCFATGELELHEQGSRLGQGRFIYIDSANPPPLERPEVDF